MYREVAAHSALAASIECVWMRDAGAGTHQPAERLVLPDNCSDIIIRLEHETIDRAAVIAVGAMSAPLPVRDDFPGRWVGVRFRPGRARQALRINAGELRDQCVPLTDLDPALERLIVRAMRAPASVRDLALALQQVFATRLAGERTPSPAVQEALWRISDSRGALAIHRLCRELRVSRQHLARLFDREVGVPPKLVARVTRVKHVMSLATRRPPTVSPPWARIAAETGYTDQSHLIADFHALVGATPAEWLAQRQVPDLLFEPAAPA